MFTGGQFKTFFLKLYDKIFDTELLDRGAQVAFYFSFSIFPLLFFLISVFGLVLESTERLQSELFTYLYQIMPASAYDLVRKTVDEIVASSTTGKLTLGLAITLWSSSIGVDSLRNALNAVAGIIDTRPWWKTKLQSLALTLVSILLLAIAVSFVFYGWQLVQIGLERFGFDSVSRWWLVTLQWVMIFAIMLASCEIVYNLLPDYKKFRWNWITPGSIVSIFLWIVFTGGFRLYLEYFNTYNRAYGSLGAVIILMLWLYLTAVVLLIGAAVNAVVADMSAEREAAVEVENDES
ncbi:YihY/virulence factor BrkB family protein [soil metagenome]